MADQTPEQKLEDQRVEQERELQAQQDDINRDRVDNVKSIKSAFGQPSTFEDPTDPTPGSPVKLEDGDDLVQHERFEEVDLPAAERAVEAQGEEQDTRAETQREVAEQQVREANGETAGRTPVEADEDAKGSK